MTTTATLDRTDGVRMQTPTRGGYSGGYGSEPAPTRPAGPEPAVARCARPTVRPRRRTAWA
ncbi:hypothetical protein IW245_002198 [Longispora fulva]|uniref:Uncharacterized protein n=1 Tax=Longispora fulva TaxID=619741 RepID=A0A8J7GNH2_9ACTN|nr:hypothetical protein [Longispora fulva]